MVDICYPGLTLMFSAQSCPQLPLYQNATHEGQSITVGSIVLLTCNTGFVLSDRQNATAIECLPSTQWNTSIKDCDGKT